ncbi:unnamed protein product, partial [Ectocarpus sp. 12 AP-2014]
RSNTTFRTSSEKSHSRSLTEKPCQEHLICSFFDSPAASRQNGRLDAKKGRDNRSKEEKKQGRSQPLAAAVAATYQQGPHRVSFRLSVDSGYTAFCHPTYSSIYHPSALPYTQHTATLLCSVVRSGKRGVSFNRGGVAAFSRTQPFAGTFRAEEARNYWSTRNTQLTAVYIRML